MGPSAPSPSLSSAKSAKSRKHASKMRAPPTPKGCGPWRSQPPQQQAVKSSPQAFTSYQAKSSNSHKRPRTTSVSDQGVAAKQGNIQPWAKQAQKPAKQARLDKSKDVSAELEEFKALQAKQAKQARRREWHYGVQVVTDSIRIRSLKLESMSLQPLCVRHRVGMELEQVGNDQNVIIFGARKNVQQAKQQLIINTFGHKLEPNWNRKAPQQHTRIFITS